MEALSGGALDFVYEGSELLLHFSCLFSSLDLKVEFVISNFVDQYSVLQIANVDQLQKGETNEKLKNKRALN